MGTLFPCRVNNNYAIKINLSMMLPFWMMAVAVKILSVCPFV